MLEFVARRPAFILRTHIFGHSSSKFAETARDQVGAETIELNETVLSSDIINYSSQGHEIAKGMASKKFKEYAAKAMQDGRCGVVFFYIIDH